MNWGYKILTVYLVFVGGILFVAFKSAGEKTDLVTQDYYAKELKYQDRIDQIDHANQLSAPVAYSTENGKLLVNFPADFKGKKITGNVTLYCPSDENKDIKHDFEATDAPVTVGIPTGRTGAYDLQVSWQVEGVNYYFEKKINI